LIEKQTMALIPIYNSKCDAEAFLEYPYIFNRTGDWIGFVSRKREVYSVLGNYVGYLTNDPRILRKFATATLRPRVTPPAAPAKVYPPATIPLAPLMSELSHSTIDVLLDQPELLHTEDVGELREDLD
jgi:hypothetical protein